MKAYIRFGLKEKDGGRDAEHGASAFLKREEFSDTSRCVCIGKFQRGKTGVFVLNA